MKASSTQKKAKGVRIVSSRSHSKEQPKQRLQKEESLAIFQESTRQLEVLQQDAAYMSERPELQ